MCGRRPRSGAITTQSRVLGSWRSSDTAVCLRCCCGERAAWTRSVHRVPGISAPCRIRKLMLGTSGLCVTPARHGPPHRKEPREKRADGVPTNPAHGGAWLDRRAEQLHHVHADGVPASSRHTRRVSAMPHACATQPTGRWGASPSRISDTLPRHASRRWCSTGVNSANAARRSPWTRNYASAYGPSSQVQTGPW